LAKWVWIFHHPGPFTLRIHHVNKHKAPSLRQLFQFSLRSMSLAVAIATAGPALAQGTWQRLVTQGNGPSVRSTPVAVAVQQSIYVFGGVKDDFSTGQNEFHADLYRFDAITSRWTALAPAGATPPARAFAAGVDVPQRQWVVVFGGASYAADFSNMTFHGDLWAYDIRANRWQQLQPVNAGPSGRSGPAVWRVNDQLYVFGGINTAGGTYGALNDLWRYDLRTNRWEQLTGQNQAGSPVTRHEATLGGGSAFAGQLTLYGGDTTTPEGGFTHLNDTWQYDLHTGQWRNITPASRNITPSRISGASAKIGHSLYLAGGDAPGGSSDCGASFPQNPTNELWRFDLVRHTWSQVTAGGDTFPAIKRTSAAEVNGRMFVFAGWGFTCTNGQGGQTWNPDVYVYAPTSHAH
jgi:N-acetylneuraminic acid mutarotase